ncbi:MAG TPA: hypothetical protein VE978_26350 [Chitinophagales bacterium]|nr:hypothetical protein [Chitinophagales bacterium]
MNLTEEKQKPEPPLSNVQMELLKLFSTNVPDEELLELKKIISRYLFEKARDKADKIWIEKGYDENTITNWLNEG